MTKPENAFIDNFEEALRKKENDDEGKDGNLKGNPDGSSGKIDVFLSYSSLNKNVADAVVSDFEQHGIRCWYAPRDIIPGQEWVTAIHEAIKACRLFVLIYTDSSNESKQVANEVALAFNSGKTLIPFKLSDAEMSSELEYYLTRVHWLDAVKPPLRQSIESLREYSEKILNGNIPKPSHVNDKEIKHQASKPWPFLAVAAVAIICIAVALIFAKNKDTKDSASDSGGEKYQITETPVVTKGPDESSTPKQTESEGSVKEDKASIYKKAYDYQRVARNNNTYDRAYECYMQTGDEVCSDEKIVAAMYELASYYYEDGSEENVKKALDLYEKAAAAGNISANNFLGSYYVELEKEREEGAESVIGKAVSYYEVSAEKGDAVALYSLGYIYENENNDLGLAPDNAKALEYYEKAMNAGNNSASRAYERVKKKTEK